MKLGIRVVLLLAAALLQAAGAQTVPQPTPFSSDVEITSGRGAAAHDVNGKMYAAAGQMRMDLNTGTFGQVIIITNQATKVADTIMPDQHMYIELNSDQAGRLGLPPNLSPFIDPSNPCASETGATCKNLGVEEVNGRSCNHWQITEKAKVSNSWIDRQLHFPIKAVSEDTTWQLTNVKEGEQDASLFQVPSGYQKMDLGQMMQGMRSPQ